MRLRKPAHQHVDIFSFVQRIGRVVDVILLNFAQVVLLLDELAERLALFPNLPTV